MSLFFCGNRRTWSTDQITAEFCLGLLRRRKHYVHQYASGIRRTARAKKPSFIPKETSTLEVNFLDKEPEEDRRTKKTTKIPEKKGSTQRSESIAAKSYRTGPSARINRIRSISSHCSSGARPHCKKKTNKENIE